MKVNDIIDAIYGAIVARGCFIVDIKVSKDNDITIIIESENGVVDLSDCEAVNDVFLAAFDRDVEDYSLTVSSAGLDQPFKILKQYLKAVGTNVEVSLKGGRRMVALLEAADENAVTLKYSVREAVEGSRKKALVEHVDTIPYSEVTAMRPYITFE